MQFIQHDKLQTAAVFNDLPVQAVLPRHEQFEHHEIREQDVGRVVPDTFPFLVGFLPGIPRERWGMRVFCAEIAPQLFCLAVRQRVHRINDDRAGSQGLARFPRLDRGINNRDEETQRLPRTSSGRDDVTLLTQGIANGLLLVLAKLESSTLGAAGGGKSPKHVGTFRFQITGTDEILERSAVCVVRVELDQRIGPEAFGGIQFIDLLFQFRRADIRK